MNSLLRYRVLSSESRKGDFEDHAQVLIWDDPRHFSSRTEPCLALVIDFEALSDVEGARSEQWTREAWMKTLQAHLMQYSAESKPVPPLWGITRHPNWASATGLLEMGARRILSLEEFRHHYKSHSGHSLPQKSHPSAHPSRPAGAPAKMTPVPLRLHASQIPYPIETLHGSSPALERLRELVRKAAPLDTTLLLKGPTGTGKELLARTIHSLSPRSSGPFVVLPCGAIPESLFEAELFGVRKGAFTGAEFDKAGILEQAQGGTLLLDGISQLSLSQQTKLLRLLQDRRATPLGSHESYAIDARILATTQVDLENAVASGIFRDDLLHRIRVLEIELPALRERRSDIPDLAQWTLTRLSRQYRKPKLQLSDEALEKLLHYSWPGNVRELENAIEHGASMAWGEGRLELQALDLPEKIQWASMATQDHDSLKEATKRFEREYIHQLLRRNGGNKEEAAEILGLSLATLYRKLAA